MGKGKTASAQTALLLRHEWVFEMLASGSLVDGRRGGLVIGPSHEEGNIYLLYQTQSGGYRILGTMEGGEYLLSHGAYLLYHHRINEINAWEHPTALVEKSKVSGESRIINAFGEKSEKIILIDHRGQFIVNKFATGRFFTEIDGLNRKAEEYHD